MGGGSKFLLDARRKTKTEDVIDGGGWVSARVFVVWGKIVEMNNVVIEFLEFGVWICLFRR